MKKSVGKVLSVIMALCLFITILPMSVSAEEIEMAEVESASMIQFSPETELNVNLGATMNKFYSNGTQVDTTKFFYNQLTSNQKALYDQILAAGPIEIIDIDMTDILISGSGKTDSAAQNNAVNSLQQDIIMALTAINEDVPLFFWIYTFGFENCEGITTRVGSNRVCTITDLAIRMVLREDQFTDFNDVKAKYDAVNAKYKTIPVYGISRHEKLKSIHDYLAKNIVYDDTISEANIFDVYGALINGVCVCEGYAEAFKLLCDREGLPCITVVGTGNGGAHKWNMVQMEDGEWYTLDATWDDQASNIYYSYFTIGSDTKAPYFNHNTVADSTVHIAHGQLFDDPPKALTYPTLSKDSYGVGILRYGAADVQFDTVRNVIMVGKDVTNYYTYVVNNSASGFSRTRNGNGTTTSTMTVSDSRTTKTYLVAMRGDVDASNAVNATDYTRMTEICATTYKVDEGTAKFYAGDMNQDGAIDGFDAIAHQLYTNGDLLFN